MAAATLRQALAWIREHVRAADPHGSAAASAAALAAHGAAADPHPGYETTAEANARFTAHGAAADPHPGYETTAEANARFTAHGAAADPHPGYATDAQIPTAVLLAANPANPNVAAGGTSTWTFTLAGVVASNEFVPTRYAPLAGTAGLSFLTTSCTVDTISIRVRNDSAVAVSGNDRSVAGMLHRT